MANELFRCVLTLIITSVLLSRGLQNPMLNSRSISHLWRLGFGAVSNESLINIPLANSTGHIMTFIFLANAPQAILSFLFFS